MGFASRNYKIEEVMAGNPPAPVLRLSDNGKIIDPATRIVFNKDKDKLKKVDHYRIRFDIKSFHNSRLRFVPSLADTIWVQPGTTCPTSPCEMPGVIWVDAVDPSGEWIDVINVDLVPQDFQFTLNFVDKSVTNPTQADYVPLDPGGTNEDRGGSGSGIKLNASAAIGLGVGAGLLAFAGASLLLAG